MIRPYIFADHQPLTSPHPGSPKFALMPRLKTFPRKISSHILFEKSRQHAPAGRVDLLDQFLIGNFKWVVQGRKLP